MVRSKSAFAAAIAVALAFGLADASAQSVRDQVVKTVVEGMKAAGGKDIRYGRVVGDDARFTIEDLKAVVEIDEAGTKKDGTVGIARMTFVGARPTSEGGYSAAEVSGEQVIVAADDTTMSFDRFRATDIVEPPPSVIKPGATLQPGRRFAHFDATGIKVDPAAGDPVSIESIAIDARDWRDTMARAGSFKVLGLNVPLSEGEGVDQLKELGYSQLVFDFDSAARWDDGSGQLTLSDFALTARNMGVLRISGTFGGLTKDVVAKLQALGAEESSQTLELLQGLTIGDFRIRFENRSIVEKGLAYAARQQGVKPQDLVDQTTQSLRLVLAWLNNKAFEQKVTKAVSTFLNAPKSIAAIAKPAQPIPVSQIFGTALTAPQTIPTLLGVDVTANQ